MSEVHIFKHIISVCGYLRNRSQFSVFIVIYVLSTSILIRDGYYYLRSKISLKIFCPVRQLLRICHLTRSSNVFQSIMHSLTTTLCYITRVFFHYWTFKELFTHPLSTTDWNFDNKNLHYFNVKIHK
jgi:hypothetical protein